MILSDEEKQAIEYLKRHIIPCYGRKGTIEFMLNDTLINLIEKQQKEIEEYNIKLLSNAGIYQLGFNDGEKSVKNKIKAEIKELQNMKVDGEVFVTAVNFAIKEMQSLLEKGVK